jgi:UDP-GlcNAc3NAcA epimerase
MLEAIEGVLLKEKPDWKLVGGDNDTTPLGTPAAVPLNLSLPHMKPVP